jgi:branched-chain amino acid aminotransferase
VSLDSPRMPLACLDGEIRESDELKIPVTDEGLLRGDGVFEVIRLYGGRPYALDEHFRRMSRSAANLRLDFDADAMRAEVEALLEAARPGDEKIRLVATRGGRRIAIVEPLPEHVPSAALACIEFAPVRILDGVKSLSYAANMLATRLAQEEGADEALLTTPHGRLLEGPTSSFFCVLEGELVTPPLSDHVLDSITRRHVLEIVEVVERPIVRDDIARMQEAFLASTPREVMPVHRIDDRELPAPGRRTLEAAERLRRRIEAELGA